MGVFGITGWKDEGWVRTARGPRRLLKAKATDRFKSAWDAAWRLLDAVGFDGSNGEHVKYWTLGKDHDHDMAALACEEAEAYVPVYAAKIAARVAERQAKAEEAAAAERARKEHERLRPDRAQAALRELMENRPWLLQPDHQLLAAQLIATTPAPAYWHTERLVKQAAATLKRCEGRLAEPAPEAGVENLVDEPFREAVLYGCRVVSGFDQDRARVANGEGWSKSATVTGHYLAARESLSAVEALHGFELLRRHRRQLSDELRGALALA
jgi:hypothetical protein